MLRNIIVKYNNFILLSIGFILIMLSMALLFYDRFEFIKSEVFADIELKKYNELQKDDDFINNDVLENENNNENINIDTDQLDEEDDVSNNENNNDNNADNNISDSSDKKYIGFLEINKISLKTGLVDKNSYYNNVNRNVEILKVSDYPDVFNGNFILASHSGTSKISYFKNLYKLELGDVATVYYKEYAYHYKIVNIYNVPKIGKVEVRRNPEKTVMTMITCTKNSKTEQTVYILELYSKTRNEV